MKWLLALVFMQDLDWSWFYSNFGFWGIFYAYIFIAWGEVALYSWILCRTLKKWGLLDGSKVSKV